MYTETYVYIYIYTCMYFVYVYVDCMYRMYLYLIELFLTVWEIPSQATVAACYAIEVAHLSMIYLLQMVFCHGKLLHKLPEGQHHAKDPCIASRIRFAYSTECYRYSGSTLSRA